VFPPKAVLSKLEKHTKPCPSLSLLSSIARFLDLCLCSWGHPRLHSCLTCSLAL
jgi:hypothetical protein